MYIELKLTIFQVFHRFKCVFLVATHFESLRLRFQEPFSISKVQAAHYVHHLL